jgi:hypothetical protein
MKYSVTFSAAFHHVITCIFDVFEALIAHGALLLRHLAGTLIFYDAG